METTETDRKNWKIGSLLQVFVASRNKWYDATVTEIFTDTDGEWLIVSIQNKILFELNRFDSNLRRHKTKEEIAQEMKEKQRLQREKEEKEESERVSKEEKKLEWMLRRKSEYNQLIKDVNIDSKDNLSSDSDISTDYYTESEESSLSSSSSSLDSLDSIHSEDELNNKFANENNEDPALIVIIIERAGTECINGKYLYNGQQRGKPLWQKDGDTKGKLWWKYDNLWTLEYDNNDFYIAYTVRVLPPSSGWEGVDKAEYPSPSVILHRLDQMETVKNYVTGAGTDQNNDNEKDNSFSPLQMMEYDFEISDDFKTQTIEQTLGFTLELNEITGLLCVNKIVSDSQSEDMGLQIGDIISNVEEEDISLLGSVEKMCQYLKDTMANLSQNENSFMILNFGRKKGTFPIVLVSRSGTKVLDGKYSIKGRANGAWKFVQNEDPKYEISRIYYDSDEDEAVWVLRTETENAMQAMKEEQQRLLLQRQNEEENQRRLEEEQRIRQQQLAEERKQKIVDERWLFPLFKDAQLSAITGSADSSKCKKQSFVEYFVRKCEINSEIVEIIWKSIDRKKKEVITTRQYFKFKTNFTMEKMRKLLPEFCPPPSHVLKSQKAAAQRKREAELKRQKIERQREAQLQKEAESRKRRAMKKKGPLPGLPEPKTVEELKMCGFKILRNLCKQNGVPPNGTKVQLFLKLRDKLFGAEEKEQKQEISIVVSTAQDQKHRLKRLKSPIAKSPINSPIMPQSPMSVEINHEIENKEEVICNSSDSEYGSLDECSSSSEGGGSPQKGKFTDYYCGMTGCGETIPPNYGWEAVEPNGVWPAPGLNIYDIDLSKADLKAPTIRKVVPSPGCATIYFECDEPRVPRVCPHLEYWFEIEAIGNEQVIKCRKSPAVFTNLINGNAYQFVAKCCSILSTKYSAKSAIVTPLLLPNKPCFTNIEGKPKELFLYWQCKNYDNKDTKATVVLRITPIIPAPKGYKANESGEIILHSKTEKNMIHLRGLGTGTDYEIQLRSSNAVGVMESAVEIATPTYPPPQPQLRKVIGGNREIIIDVRCEGWNNAETKCWFEVDVNPEEPTLEFLQSQIYASKSKKRQQKQESTAVNPVYGALSPRGGVTPAHLRKKSIATMNRLQSARSRATFSTVLARIDLSKVTQQLQNDEDMKSNEMQPFAFGGGDDDSEEYEIPVYKRKKRYQSLPIIIAPLVNGEEYIVTVRARNYTQIKSSEASEFITPKGVPPKPRINSVASRDGEVKILFECDDYATLEYRAVYEVVSLPKTTKTKTRRFNMKCRNLDNGTQYSLKIRGVNSLGKGEWSEESALVKPLKLPLNIQEMRMVPGNEEVSLYWVCDELSQPKYDGWYEVSTKPVTCTIITKRQQCTFKGLVNDCEYKFRVYAMNLIGRSNKHESVSIKPKSNVKLGLYNTLKQKTANNIRELRESYVQSIVEKERKTKQELGGEKRKKGKIITAQQQFESEKSSKKSKNKKRKKKKKKGKKKLKKGGFELGDFASMIQKQQNQQQNNNNVQASDDGKSAMNQARDALFARKRHTSIMDVTRIDNFSHKFQNVKKK